MKIEASILKFKNFTIPINHYKQEKSNGLLIVFPGGGYSSNAPALYYTINFYQEHFFDVLTIDYDFKTFHYEGDRDLFLKQSIKNLRSIEFILWQKVLERELLRKRMQT